MNAIYPALRRRFPALLRRSAASNSPITIRKSQAIMMGIGAVTLAAGWRQQPACGRTCDSPAAL